MKKGKNNSKVTTESHPLVDISSKQVGSISIGNVAGRDVVINVVHETFIATDNDQIQSHFIFSKTLRELVGIVRERAKNINRFLSHLKGGFLLPSHLMN